MLGASLQEGKNGLSYNFGINIARGLVQEITRTAIGAATLTGAMYALIQGTNDLDERLKKGTIFFGGYANSLKAVNFAMDKIESGKTFSSIDNVMSGMQALSRAGIDAKKNFDLVARAADATGSEFSDIASIIQGGDFGKLADLGLITDRMAQSMSNYGYNAQQASNAVLQIVKNADKTGLFKDTIRTFPQIITQFQTFGHDIVRAIVGDSRDPESLQFKVKSVLQKIMEFWRAHNKQITGIAHGIGAVIKFVLGVVYDMVRSVTSYVSSLINTNGKFWDNFQERMRGFVLYLGILRVKIKSFFDEYGASIRTVLKIAAAFWVFGKLLNFFRLASSGAYSLATALENISSGSFMKNFGKRLSDMFSISRWRVVFRSLGRTFSGFFSSITSFGKDAYSALKKGWQLVYDVGASIWDATKLTGKNIFARIVAFTSKSATIIKDGFGAAWDVVSSSAKRIWISMVGGIQKIVPALRLMVIQAQAWALAINLSMLDITLIAATVAMVGVAIYQLANNWTAVSEGAAKFYNNYLLPIIHGFQLMKSLGLGGVQYAAPIELPSEKRAKQGFSDIKKSDPTLEFVPDAKDPSMGMWVKKQQPTAQLPSINNANIQDKNSPFYKENKPSGFADFLNNGNNQFTINVNPAKGLNEKQIAELIPKAFEDFLRKQDSRTGQITNPFETLYK